MRAVLGTCSARSAITSSPVSNEASGFGLTGRSPRYVHGAVFCTMTVASSASAGLAGPLQRDRRVRRSVSRKYWPTVERRYSAGVETRPAQPGPLDPADHRGVQARARRRR